jgi:hypothetical protein
MDNGLNAVARCRPTEYREELMIAFLAELPPFMMPMPGVLAVSPDYKLVNIAAVAVVVIVAVAAAVSLRK